MVTSKSDDQRKPTRSMYDKNAYSEFRKTTNRKTRSDKGGTHNYPPTRKKISI